MSRLFKVKIKNIQNKFYEYSTAIISHERCY